MDLGHFYFILFFGKQLGPFVVIALNKTFKDGELSTTQKEGLITCIPKGAHDNLQITLKTRDEFLS